MAQNATFGSVVRLGGTPSDAVLDESRSRIYLVNQNSSRIDVYDYVARRVASQIPVGASPVAAALSMDSRFLYVSNNGASTVSVIDLSRGDYVSQTVALSAKPEGLAVGADGRVVITTEGTSTTDQINSLLLFDPTQAAGQQVTPVPFPPPPPTPSPLNAVVIGRPTTTFRGKLERTPDGHFIIGLSTVNSNAQTILFVLEADSGTVLRSRTVTGESTVLSIAPDGSRFMAGYTLYETSTLNVLAQYNAANVPFPLSSTGTVTFNSTQNMGGSAFSSDGETLYSAFNVAPVTVPASSPKASTLMISNPRNLAVRLGIKIPESIVAKMLILSKGDRAFGLSESGLIDLPLATIFDYPILMADTTTVFLAVDDCNRGLARAMVNVYNAGKGKLTFSVPDATAALVAQASSGMTPATVEFLMEPGRTSVTRQYGTNLYSGAATNTGTAVSLNLSSPEAINVPSTIRVYMNVRQPDQRGVIFPVTTGPTAAEGLHDIVVDEVRNRVYVTNSGYNRIEVFDRATQRFTDPIEVGQMPHQMAMASDNKRLFVANTGGETIGIVDLDAKKMTGKVTFPARPRSGTSNPVSPQAIAYGLFGLQVAMSDGSQWKVTGADANTRAASAVIPTQITTTGNNGPVRMMAAPGGESMITMAGNGTVYRYDGMSDSYTNSTRPYTQQVITGYYGPLAAGPDGSYFAANAFLIGSSLAVIGGSESPAATQTYPMATRRNVAALGAIDENRLLRLTTPVKSSITATPTSDARPVLEMLDLRDNSVTAVGAVAENPAQSLFGTTRLNVPPRQIAVDSQGTAYMLTLSGMTMAPLDPVGASRPQIAAQNGVVNANDGSRTLRAGSFVTIRGSNLASTAVNAALPLPSVTGGSCVTFSDVALPILQSGAGQILAQVPDTLAPGNYVAVVRSLATGQRSDPVVVTVQ